MPHSQSFHGYHLEDILHHDQHLVLGRATRQKDNLRILFKKRLIDSKFETDLALLKGEYELTFEPPSSGVLRAIELLQLHDSLILVMENFPGVLLEELLQSPMEIDFCLEIAIQISQILAELHQHGITHRSLAPNSLLIEPSSGRVRVINLAAASLLQEEYQELVNPASLGKNLSYLAPEQTGRMNCPIDQRCDFYALGILCYQMLTGAVPFPDTDPLHLIYAHLAHQPRRPSRLRPALPAALDRLVLKLLEKHPEDRYQSARGLLADLQLCRDGLRSPANLEKFIPGEYDLPTGLKLPHKLYGRKAEISKIIQVFELSCQGGRELLMVGGFSGVGKTALVREVYRPITRVKGYFGHGKFDQLHKNIPYCAIVEALRGLTKQLLSEAETQLQVWRQRLSTALGRNAALLTDVVPELELIIGPQPGIEELSPSEAQNRFHLVFRQLINAFSHVDHPLVLFLDDLQWIDTASLRLIRVMIEDPAASHLMIIGAYRDNEVDETHPLSLALDDLRENGTTVHAIQLAPLAEPEIKQLLCDTLGTADARIVELADLLREKTHGNPFFLRQFLNRLHSDKLLRFDPEMSGWVWDIALIKAQNISDNVVELMRDRLLRLPPTGQKILSLAACIGNSFELEELAIINQAQRKETFAALFPALKAGLVVNTTGFEVTSQNLPDAQLVILNFRFSHDRIQQAAYELIEPTERQSVHLHIGRHLWAGIAGAGQQKKIYSIADHLNAGRSRLDTAEELVELATINLRAASKAKEATAYSAALSYLQAGMERLPETVWQDHYSLAFELHRLRAAVEHLNGHFEASQSFIHRAVEHAGSPIEKADLLHMLIVQYTLGARYPEAIDLARSTLSMLSIDLPAEDFTAARDEQMKRIDKKMVNRLVASLIDLPDMVDPAMIVAMKILTAMGPPCYRSHQHLWAVIVAMEMNLLLDHGNVAAASYTYTSYGGLLGYVRNDYRDCPAYAELALAVAKKYSSSSDLSVGHLMVGASLDHWHRHLRFAEQSYQNAYQVGLDSGNLQYSVYAFGHRMYCRFFRGTPIRTQLQQLPNFLAFSQARKNQWGIDLKLAVLMILRNLSGETDRLIFESHLEPEEDYLERCTKQNNIQVLCIYHLLKAYALYLHGAYGEAQTCLEQAGVRLYSVATQGLLPAAEYSFVESLLLSARLSDLPGSEQAGAVKTLQANLAKLSLWSENCRENFQHKKLLLEAELAAHKGEIISADRLYEFAAEEAARQGFIQHQALAFERCAEMWLKIEKNNFTISYLKRALQAYQSWGAQQKVAALQRRIETLDETVIPTRPMQEAIEPSLDMRAVIKASQAISKQLRYEDLVTALTRIVLEASGAQKALFLIPAAGHLLLVSSIDQQQGTKFFEPPQTLTDERSLSFPVINYVMRSHEPIVLNLGEQSDQFSGCPYLNTKMSGALLCMPLLNRGQLTGVIYLENDLNPAAFRPDRLQPLQLLASQAAISLENATFYRNMELKVAEQTSELCRATEELRHSEKRYRALFSTMIQPMALFKILSDPTGPTPIAYRFIDVNPALERFFNKSAESILNRSLTDLYPNLSYDWLEMFGKVAKTGTPLHLRQFFNPLERHLEVLIYQPAEDQLAVIAIDVSDQVKAEEERKVIQEQMFQSQKLESLGVLAGGVAHNFNNNLAIILGNLELARLRFSGQIETLEPIGNAIIATRRSAELIKKILKYSRQTKQDIVSLKIVSVIEETYQMIRSMIPRTVELSYQVPDILRCLTIKGESAHLQEALVNLCNNAVHAMNEIGTLTLALTQIELGKDEVPIRYACQPGEYACVAVSDTGCGIPDEIIEKIFDPFFTTKEVGQGTGLGLSTVQGIVEQHGGMVRVESRLGEGTHFELLFPLIEQENLQAQQPNHEELCAGTERILFVDDEEMLADTCKLMLTETGYRVSVVNDALLALEMFMATPQDFDLLITDQTMPKMTGMELIEKVRKLRPDLPVILCTGYSSKVSEQAAEEHGINAFCMKPFEMPQFLKLVREVLDNSQPPGRCDFPAK